MSEPEEYQSPIFVGGTGRSGTTVIGSYLNSHKNITMPTAENKLIVQQDGLRTLIEILSQEHDNKAEHAAIRRFIDYSTALRKCGFQNNAANLCWRSVDTALRLTMGKRLPLNVTARSLPFLACSSMGIGTNYGRDHYDKCVHNLLSELIARTDKHRVFAAEGLIKPFYYARRITRLELLRLARSFLQDLNKPLLFKAGAIRWCDTTPQNVRYADFLKELYPQAKLVHIVRDPRDVAASYIQQSWTSKDREATLDQLRQHYAAVIKVEERAPRNFMKTIRLEDFTKNKNGERQELYEFLAIDHTDFNESVDLVSSSFGRWKKDFAPSEARELEKSFEDICCYFDYR